MDDMKTVEALADPKADRRARFGLGKSNFERLSMADESMVYAERFPGVPGFGAVCVDRPEFARSTAKDLASWIRRGATVERVEIEVARAGMRAYIAAMPGQQAAREEDRPGENQWMN